MNSESKSVMKPQCRFPRRLCLGFTLVELLAVVAIIAVLVAITLPVVGTVRRKAKLSTCMANFRQITVAYTLQMGDNKGTLYYLNGSINGSGGSGQIAGDQSSASQGGYFTRLLEPYGLPRAKWTGWNQPIANRYQTVWYCPVTTDVTVGITGHGCTYYYYNLGQYIGQTDTPARLAAVSDFVSKKPYLRDFYGSHSDPRSNYANNGDADSKKLVYAYLDGHIEYR